ncbi:hypothetical protein FZEAL_6957 [Fusarium zealandicum]|uniref:Major facilitator superfamily transporter n=1 Tax=Fusarium zealandicum TaxID=1053134 RepID=A0A8H4XJC5_9HYPO|nr:hypothetical protein FZEAL_6957 [Fusarium zealandicum]
MMKSTPGSRESIHVAGSVFFVSSAGRVLKLPIPSSCHRDPLTWRPSKRFFAFFALQFYSVVSALGVNLPGLLTTAFGVEFGHNDTGPFSIESLSSAMTLFTGLGYIVGIPLSLAVGRRPVILGASVVTSAATLWAGNAGDFYQLLIALSIQALACGVSVGLSVLIIIDATFIHERPNALSLMWCLVSAVIRLSMIILPFSADLNHYWRCVYVVWVGPCVVAFVLLWAFVPETFFMRPPIALDGRILVQGGSEKVQVYEDWEEKDGSDCVRPPPDLPPKSAFWSRFKIARAPGSSYKAMWATYVQMFLCILNPLTFWVSLLTGVILSGVIFLNLVQPTLLAEQHGGTHSIESVSVLLGAAGIVGSVLAFPATGPFASWFIRYSSLRNSGVRHAEVYLPIFAIPVVSGLVSVILNGLAIHNNWPPYWLYITSAISIFSYLTGSVAFTLWITEAFPRWAAAALAVQLFTGNMTSFGIGTAVLRWCKTREIIPPTAIISGLILCLGVLAVPAAFYGKNVRQYIQGRWSDSQRGALRPQ